MKKVFIETRIKIALLLIFLSMAVVAILAVFAFFEKINAAWILIPSCLQIPCAILWSKWIAVPCRQAKRAMAMFASGYSLKSFTEESCLLFPELEAVQKTVDSIIDIDKVMGVSQRQAQFLALQNQINPHFLYNTLEGIRSEALTNGLESIANIAEAMSRFFRYTISGMENIVTLEMELENAQNYFLIQKYRFGSRLSFEVDMGDDDIALKCRFPKLTLQPIVENAILHGLECKAGEGHLKVGVVVAENRLIVTVSDDGVGMDETVLSDLQNRLVFRSFGHAKDASVDGRHGGIALENVNNRIKILFGEEYGLYLESTPNVGTDVHISLPLSMEADSI